MTLGEIHQKLLFHFPSLSISLLKDALLSLSSQRQLYPFFFPSPFSSIFFLKKNVTFLESSGTFKGLLLSGGGNILFVC